MLIVCYSLGYLSFRKLYIYMLKYACVQSMNRIGWPSVFLCIVFSLIISGVLVRDKYKASNPITDDKEGEGEVGGGGGGV